MLTYLLHHLLVSKGLTLICTSSLELSLQTNLDLLRLSTIIMLFGSMASHRCQLWFKGSCVPLLVFRGGTDWGGTRKLGEAPSKFCFFSIHSITRFPISAAKLGKSEGRSWQAGKDACRPNTLSAMQKRHCGDITHSHMIHCLL